MIDPVVSICCITYNHEPFIANAIEGFLMQKTVYPYEIIIGDDYSTDKTREIIESYAKHHPELIKIITSDRNVGVIANENRVLTEAKGKYIAFCEGDDFWTNASKLQKQVEFLEKHPEFSVSFHRLKHHDISSDSWYAERNDDMFNNNVDYIEFDYNEYHLESIELMPVTMVFRKEKLDLFLSTQYKYYRDEHQFYHLLRNGKGNLFYFVGAVRNIHNGGICGSRTSFERSKDSVKIFNDLYNVNKDPIIKREYIKSLQNHIYISRKQRKIQDQIASSFKQFVTERSIFRLASNLKRIFPLFHEKL